mmetsp:Transcript_29776/g.45391  ORF Transcript_29776/g.45391 Transcript_29776/m.45391 type:complete len:235 (-) Transcript_29776:185-889(-)
MADHFLDGEGLTADVAGYLVLLVDFHYDLGGLSHHSVRAQPALVVLALAAELAKQLPAIGVGALQRCVNHLLTTPAEEVFVEIIDGWVAQANDVEALHKLDLLLIRIYLCLGGEHEVLLDGLGLSQVGLHYGLRRIDILDARGIRIYYSVAESATRQFAARVLNLLDEGVGRIALVLILRFRPSGHCFIRNSFELGVQLGAIGLALGVQAETHLTRHFTARLLKRVGPSADLRL